MTISRVTLPVLTAAMVAMLAVGCGGGSTEPEDVSPQATALAGGRVAPPPITQIAVDTNQNCVLMGGGAKCWNGSTLTLADIFGGMTGILQITVGANECARTAQAVVCQGNNSWGQNDIPVGVDQAGVLDIDTGWGATCMIKSDTTATCWGRQAVDALPADLRGFSKIAVGGSFVCGVVAGSARCWDNSGAMGAAVPTGLKQGVVSVTAGTGHACALTAAGSVACWGNNDRGQTNVPAGLPASKIVVAGYRHTCSVAASDGSVVCWGDNSAGQATPERRLNGVYAIDAGWLQTCAVNDNGVLCWGYDDQVWVNDLSLVPRAIKGRP